VPVYNILWDYFSESGVPLLKPFINARMYPPVRYKVGSYTEKVIHVASIFMFLYLFFNYEHIHISFFESTFDLVSEIANLGVKLFRLLIEGNL
jgi:hypothetical protein